MKTLFLLLDGLGDLPVKEMSSRTPLEAAKTPFFDNLVGKQGLLEPVGLGKEVPIEDASLMTFSLLGYDARKFHIGRGMLEAIGAGMKVKEGDLAIRCDFATVDRNDKIVDIRAGRIENTKVLEKAINAMDFGYDFEFKATTKHRAILVFKGNFDDKISQVDPHKVGEKVMSAKPLNQKSAEAARVINDFLCASRKVLENHLFNKGRKYPANFLLPRGFGSHVPKLQNFNEKYNLKKSCALTGLPTNIGICKLIGLKVITVPEDIGNKELAAKKNPLKSALKNHDFVFAHFKNTDIAGHDGDAAKKKIEIEKIDSFMQQFDLGNVKIVVAADHCTPCIKKAHTNDLIPSKFGFVVGNNKTGIKFCEKNCKDYKMPQHKFLDFVLQ